MGVRRNLAHRQRDRLRAARLCQDEAVALMQRNPAAQVRQPEGALAVAAIGGADQVEQSLVLGDRKKLSLAEHPAGRGEIAGEDTDLAYIRLCHGCVSSSLR